jgi:sortase A
MNRPVNIPHRDTPNPRQQHAAADLLRAQIAQIYDDEEGTTTQTQSETTVPKTYQHTYTEERPQYDWQAYHKAWQNYYQQYYQRYYLYHIQQLQQQEATRQQLTSQSQGHLENGPQPVPAIGTVPEPQTIAGHVPEPESSKDLTSRLKNSVRDNVEKRAGRVKRSQHFKPIASALAVGLLFLIVQFNSIIAAEFKYYVSPGTSTDVGGSIIVDPASATVSSSPEIIIPKIDVDVPVVYGVTSYDNTTIEDNLENGVVHYGTTALPGQVGNDVIVGHSSNEVYAPGNYKFAFVLLGDLDNGDIIMLNYQGTRYVYQVFNKAVVKPTDFSLVDTNPTSPVLTLITCTPPGTSLDRMVIQAKQISPDPSTDTQAPKSSSSSQPTTLPGNAPTVFDRLTSIL